MAGLSDFNYQGYMTAIGVDPSIANRDFTDEEKSMIYQDAVKRFYQAYGQEISDSPFYSTPKERHEYALEKTLTLLPDGRSMFGLPQQRNPEDIFDTEDFRNFVANEGTGTENMDYLLDTYAAKQTDKDRLKWEFGLEGMTKKQFRELFAERTGIDESFTRDDILNRRFGAQYVGEAGEAKKTGYKAAAYKSMLDAKVLALKTAQTLRDALPGENTESSQWLDKLTENAKKAVEDYGYVGKYDNVTITDALKEGPFTLAGKIFTSAVESWATSGASIGAAIFLPFVAPGAAAAGGATAAATGLAARVLSKEAIKTIARGGLKLISALGSAQEIGGVRQEIEEKNLYDPNNPLDALMAGAVAASLDRVGAMSARARLAAFRHKSVTEGMRSGLRGEQLTKFLELKMKDSELKQIEKYIKRGFVGNTLMAMGTEGVTEGLQEFPGMLLAKHKGHEYTTSEWWNRPLEAGLVGAVLGGGTHVAGTLTGKIAGREKTVQDVTEEQKRIRAELAKYQDTGQDNIDAGVRLKVAQRLNTAGDLNMTVDGNTVVLTYGGHFAEVIYDENRHKGFNTPEQKQAMLAEEAVTNIIQQLNESRNKIEEDLDAAISRDGDDSVLTIKNPDNRTDTVSTRPQNLVIRIKNVGEERGRTILRELVDRHNNDSDALVLRTSQEFDARNREVDPDVVARSVLDRNNTYMGTRNRKKYALANEEPFEIQVGGLEGDEKSVRGYFGTKNDKGQIKLDDLLQEARNKGYEVIGNPSPTNLILTKNGVVFQLSIRNREAGKNAKSGNFPIGVDVVTTDVARGGRSRSETVQLRDDGGNIINGGIVSLIPSIPGLRILPGTQENDNLPRINSDDFTDFANMIGTDVTDPNQAGSIRRVEYSYEENGERKTRTLSFYVMGRKGGGARIFVHNGKKFVSEMISLNDLSNLEDSELSRILNEAISANNVPYLTRNPIKSASEIGYTVYEINKGQKDTLGRRAYILEAKDSGGNTFYWEIRQGSRGELVKVKRGQNNDKALFDRILQVASATSIEDLENGFLSQFRDGAVFIIENKGGAKPWYLSYDGKPTQNLRKALHTQDMAKANEILAALNDAERQGKEPYTIKAQPAWYIGHPECQEAVLFGMHSETATPEEIADFLQEARKYALAVSMKEMDAPSANETEVGVSTSDADDLAENTVADPVAQEEATNADNSPTLDELLEEEEDESDEDDIVADLEEDTESLGGETTETTQVAVTTEEELTEETSETTQIVDSATEQVDAEMAAVAPAADGIVDVIAQQISNASGKFNITITDGNGVNFTLTKNEDGQLIIASGTRTHYLGSNDPKKVADSLRRMGFVENTQSSPVAPVETPTPSESPTAALDAQIAELNEIVAQTEAILADTPASVPEEAPAETQSTDEPTLAPPSPTTVRRRRKGQTTFEPVTAPSLQEPVQEVVEESAPSDKVHVEKNLLKRKQVVERVKKLKEGETLVVTDGGGFRYAFKKTAEGIEARFYGDTGAPRLYKSERGIARYLSEIGFAETIVSRQEAKKEEAVEQEEKDYSFSITPTNYIFNELKRVEGLIKKLEKDWKKAQEKSEQPSQNQLVKYKPLTKKRMEELKEMGDEAHDELAAKLQEAMKVYLSDFMKLLQLSAARAGVMLDTPSDAQMNFPLNHYLNSAKTFVDIVNRAMNLEDSTFDFKNILSEQGRIADLSKVFDHIRNEQIKVPETAIVGLLSVSDEESPLRGSMEVTEAEREFARVNLLFALSNTGVVSFDKLSTLMHLGAVRTVVNQAEAWRIVTANRSSVEPRYSVNGKIQGFVLNGRIYLVADELQRTGQYAGVFLHECGVHFRKFGMSDQGFKEILDTVKNRVQDVKALAEVKGKENLTKEERAFLDAVRRVEKTGMDESNEHYWEEVTAYVVEKFPSTEQGLIGRVVSWFRSYLYRWGFLDPKDIRISDLVAFARGAARGIGVSNFSYNWSEVAGDQGVMDDFAEKFGMTSNELLKQYTDTYKQYRYNEDGTEKGNYLKAPNGKYSNLVNDAYPADSVNSGKFGRERLWVLTRTPAFIEWFGDWVNNPNESMSLDENGEPRIVYRGGNEDDVTFDNKLDAVTFEDDKSQVFAGFVSSKDGSFRSVDNNGTFDRQKVGIFYSRNVTHGFQSDHGILFSVADVARLTYDFGNFKDVSLKQFTDRFQKYITNRDNTMEDVERICADYIENVIANPAKHVPQLDPRKLNYLRYFFIENGESRGQLYDEGNAKHNNDATNQQTQVIALYRESLSEKDFSRLYELLSIPRNEQTKEQKDEISALDSRARFGDLTKQEIDRFFELSIKGRNDLIDLIDETTTAEELEVIKEREREDEEFYKLKERITTLGKGLILEADTVNDERNKKIKELARYFKDNTDYHSTEKALILWGAMRYAVSEKIVNDNELEVKLWKLADNNDAQIMVIPGEWTAKIVDHLRKGETYEDAMIESAKEMKEISAAKRGVPPGFTGWKVYEKNGSYEAGQELQQAVAGTGWCTGAAVSTAQTHRAGGDFHVYFKNGEPTIAIRTENGKMAEPPRGAHEGQFCTPEEEAIAEEYIRTEKRIVAGEDYLQDREDIRRLASGEMTWQEVFMMPPKRRYANGYQRGADKWPEGVKKAISDILERHKEERKAAGWYYLDEVQKFNQDTKNIKRNARLIKTDKFSNAVIEGEYPELITVIGNTIYLDERSVVPKLTTIEGDLTIEGKVDVSSLRSITGRLDYRGEEEVLQVENLRGLIIDSNKLKDKKIIFPNLTKIEFFKVTRGEVSFPNLVSIIGDYHNEISKRIDAPSLTTIEGSVITDRVSLPSLTTIKGDAEIREGSKLPSLTTIEGTAEIRRGIDVSSLITIGKSAFIFENVNASSLVSIGTYAIIGENSIINNLRSIGGDADIGPNVIAPELVNIKGEAVIKRNVIIPKIKNIEDDAKIFRGSYLPSLVSIGGSAYIESGVNIDALETIGKHATLAKGANVPSLKAIGTVRGTGAGYSVTIEEGVNAPLLDSINGGSTIHPSANVPLFNDGSFLFSFSDEEEQSYSDIRKEVKGAPGVYVHGDGTFSFNQREMPQGRENETLVYGAVRGTRRARELASVQKLREWLRNNQLAEELGKVEAGNTVFPSNAREDLDTRLGAMMRWAILNEGEASEMPYSVDESGNPISFYEGVTQAIKDAAHVSLHTSQLEWTDEMMASVANALGGFENEILDPSKPPTQIFAGLNRNMDRFSDANVFRDVVSNLAQNDAVQADEYDENGNGIIRPVDDSVDGVAGEDNFEYVVNLDLENRDAGPAERQEAMRAAVDRLKGSRGVGWHNDLDDFYRNLAAKYDAETDEVNGAIGEPARREDVERFLQAALPFHIRERIEIHYEPVPLAKEILRGAYGIFFPFARGKKMIHVRAWDRTFGQVIATVAHESSHFGWSMWGSSRLEKAISDLYMHTDDDGNLVIAQKMYEVIPQYFQMFGYNESTLHMVPEARRVYLMDEYFARINHDLLGSNTTDVAAAIGIDSARYTELKRDIDLAIAEVHSNLMQGISGMADDETVKAFAEDILKMTMGSTIGRGVDAYYDIEGTDVGGGKRTPTNRVYIYVNDYGQRRQEVAQTDEGQMIGEIREVLDNWNNKFGRVGKNFAKFILQNFPMRNHFRGIGKNGSIIPGLHVEHGKLGEQIATAHAAVMIGHVMRKISENMGVELRKRNDAYEHLVSAFKDKHFDPAVLDEHSGTTYVEKITDLGYGNDKKLMDAAELADESIAWCRNQILGNALEIRRMIKLQADNLARRMRAAYTAARMDHNEIIERIEKMYAQMGEMASKYSGEWTHRMYRSYSEEGYVDLSHMLDYLTRNPNDGRPRFKEEQEIAQRKLDNLDELRGKAVEDGGITEDMYRTMSEQPKRILRLAKRLDALEAYVKTKMGLKQSVAAGAEYPVIVLNRMIAEIKEVMGDSEKQMKGRIGDDHLNTISAAMKRELDDRRQLDRLYMEFLEPETNRLKTLLHSVDQQNKILMKLQFNMELGEHILDTGMGNLQGLGRGERRSSDLGFLERGSFLQFIEIEDIFMEALEKEYAVQRSLRETVWGGVIDAWKANNTIYSLKLGVSNYVGNISLLMAGGHFLRWGNMRVGSAVAWNQWKERMGLIDENDWRNKEKEIIDLMRENHLLGGTVSDTRMIVGNTGIHEQVIHEVFKGLRAINSIGFVGERQMENAVKNILNRFRQFYAYGDEWIKPMIFMNNLDVAYAKYEAMPEFADMAPEERKRLAAREAARQTMRESTTWEMTSRVARELSARSIRLVTPDFVMHNFQMMRIIAANFVRHGEIGDELRKLDELEKLQGRLTEKQVAYRSQLADERVRRKVGGAFTMSAYGTLMATGMGLIPYLMNMFLATLNADSDDDEEKKKVRQQKFEEGRNGAFTPREWDGAVRMVNWLTGGNNLHSPVFRDRWNIYTWNYVRSNAMLTHAPVRSANDEWHPSDVMYQMLTNLMDLQSGTMTQELINNVLGRDKWGREIGVEEGLLRVMNRAVIPGAVRQLWQVAFETPSTDTLYHSGRAIKVPELAGITVNKYDIRDVANRLGYFLKEKQSNSGNYHRRDFKAALDRGKALSDGEILELVRKLKKNNQYEMGKATYLLTGLREIGMTEQELTQYLTVSRKGADPLLGQEWTKKFLSGSKIFDESMIEHLKRERNTLIKGRESLRMSREELATVLQNYDKAIRIYSQALRTN